MYYTYKFKHVYTIFIIKWEEKWPQSTKEQQPLKKQQKASI